MEEKKTTMTRKNQAEVNREKNEKHHRMQFEQRADQKAKRQSCESRYNMETKS
jgi:hypothetical protein